MNRERILEVADEIEKLDPERFDMSNFITAPGQEFPSSTSAARVLEKEPEHWCNTAGCIAGHTVLMFMEKSAIIDALKKHAVDDCAQAILGLDDYTAGILFYGHPRLDLERVSQRQAAATLRNLVETGEVNWDVDEWAL